MSHDTRPENSEGPLRHFRVGRRALLQSLATGVGVTVFASQASAAAHVHHAAAASGTPAETSSKPASLQFLDQHAFDTLALLGEQIVPGSRAVQTPEFLDRLLAVESQETQKRFTQALGAFERAAREAHGKPWKLLSDAEAQTLLTRISSLPESDATRRAFDGLKGAVAETYYSTEVGMKELGWNSSIVFAPPAACG